MISRVTKFIFSLFIISLFGCADIIQKPEIISFKNPKITDLDNEKFTLEADLNIYNPNWFELSAQDLEYTAPDFLNLLTRCFYQKFLLLVSPN